MPTAATLVCLSVLKLRQEKLLFLCILPGVLSESAGVPGAQTPGLTGQGSLTQNPGQTPGRADTGMQGARLALGPTRDAEEGGSLRQLVAELPDLVDTRKRK